MQNGYQHCSQARSQSFSLGGYKYCLIVVYEISFLRKLSRVMHSLYA